MNISQRIRTSTLFKDVEPHVLSELERIAFTRTYPGDEVIFLELSEGNELFIIDSGTVSIQFALANQDQHYQIVELGPGDVLGEVSFIENGQRSATAIAETDVQMVVLECDRLRHICEQNPVSGYKILMAVSRILCERLRRWNIRMLDSANWGML